MAKTKTGHWTFLSLGGRSLAVPTRSSSFYGRWYGDGKSMWERENEDSRGGARSNCVWKSGITESRGESNRWGPAKCRRGKGMIKTHCQYHSHTTARTALTSMRQLHHHLHVLWNHIAQFLRWSRFFWLQPLRDSNTVSVCGWQNHRVRLSAAVLTLGSRIFSLRKHQVCGINHQSLRSVS